MNGYFQKFVRTNVIAFLDEVERFLCENLYFSGGGDPGEGDVSVCCQSC